MNLLNKLTIKNLRLNKKRTIVTIIGIMLSVALITSVATMYFSMIKSLINFEISEKGNFHTVFYDVSSNEIDVIKNNRGIDKLYFVKDIGYAKIESKNVDKPYAFIKGFTSDALNNLSVNLVEGRLPENDDEIVIPTHLKTNGRVIMNIGDSITLDVGKRISLDEKAELKQDSPFSNEEDIIETISKTYKIVGIINRPATNIESYTAPGYTFITYMDKDNMSGNIDVYAKYTKNGSKNHYTTTANILGIDAECFKIANTKEIFGVSSERQKEIEEELLKAKYSFSVNTYLIQLENNPLGEESAGGLGIVVGIVIIIIIVTSVFCIKNSFDISITEKIKQYGMLRSIGATKKQIKRNVFYEGIILGLIGIPPGLLFGFLASYILVIVCNLLIGDMFARGLKIVISYSWITCIIAIILGIVTIYFSALKSARKAAKVTPLESIRNSANVKIKSKKIKCPKIIKKIFGIGGEISYKNLKRNKKKYRTTVISIIVSTSVFIALSYFITSAFDEVKNEANVSEYNISVSANISDKSFKDKLFKTVNFDNIKDYSITKERGITINNPKYNSEFLRLINADLEYINRTASMTIIAVGDYQFKKYLDELGLDYDLYKDKGLLYSENITVYYKEEEQEKSKDLKRYDFKNGDIIHGETSNDKTLDIEIYNVDEAPFGYKSTHSSSSILIVSDEIFNEHYPNCDSVKIYYKSSDADKLQDDIYAYIGEDNITVDNIDESVRAMNNFITLIAIFLYGFIIVISLIGITNIFNTITTNMELRKSEFAMLKSIGMTNNEFKRMIRLESVFMGVKSLVFGIPIGLILSYAMYKALNIDMDGAIFKVPYSSIIISIIVVYLLITVLMKYSISKINKHNLIETIRNENI